MKFNYEPNVKTVEHQETKQKNRLAILSYKAAYERLIEFIDNHYWKLKWVALNIDQTLAEDKEIQALRIDFFIPVKDKSHWGSDPAGEKKLLEFLRHVYIIQSYTSPEEGCLPLLRCIEGVITSKMGHFSGQLASAVQKGIFQAIRPQSYEKTVVLTEELANQGEKIMNNLQTQARICCDRYFDRSVQYDDTTLITYCSGI